MVVVIAIMLMVHLRRPTSQSNRFQGAAISSHVRRPAQHAQAICECDGSRQQAAEGHAPHATSRVCLRHIHWLDSARASFHTAVSC